MVQRSCFPPFDLNIPFSAHASSEDLKGFFGPTSLLADTNDNYRKQLNHQQQQQQQQQQMNGNYNHKPNVTAKVMGMKFHWHCVLILIVFDFQ